MDTFKSRVFSFSRQVSNGVQSVFNNVIDMFEPKRILSEKGGDLQLNNVAEPCCAETCSKDVCYFKACEVSNARESNTCCAHTCSSEVSNAEVSNAEVSNAEVNKTIEHINQEIYDGGVLSAVASFAEMYDVSNNKSEVCADIEDCPADACTKKACSAETCACPAYKKACAAEACAAEACAAEACAAEACVATDNRVSIFTPVSDAV